MNGLNLLGDNLIHRITATAFKTKHPERNTIDSWWRDNVSVWKKGTRQYANNFWRNNTLLCCVCKEERKKNSAASHCLNKFSVIFQGTQNKQRPCWFAPRNSGILARARCVRRRITECLLIILILGVWSWITFYLHIARHNKNNILLKCVLVPNNVEEFSCRKYHAKCGCWLSSPLGEIDDEIMFAGNRVKITNELIFV